MATPMYAGFPWSIGAAPPHPWHVQAGDTETDGEAGSVYGAAVAILEAIDGEDSYRVVATRISLCDIAGVDLAVEPGAKE